MHLQYADCMATVQSRDVSEKALRRLKARAAEEGLSLSVYLGRQLEQIAERPTLAEMAKRLRTRTPTRLSDASVKALHDGRAER
jgi:antitoxin FitA